MSSDDDSERESQRCQAREFKNGVQCDQDAVEFVTYCPRAGRDVETWYYCAEHAESFAEKCATSVVGRGELDV